MADTKIPKFSAVRLTKHYVTFKKEDFENLKQAYYDLYMEYKNDSSVGPKVKYEWLGHYLMLSEICGKWAFPTIRDVTDKNHKVIG